MLIFIYIYFFIDFRSFEQQNITVYLNRSSASCKFFQKIEKRGNVYNFNFYCHSNHKEICELLKILKPESMTFLFSEIDKEKRSDGLKLDKDLPRKVVLKRISTNPSINNESPRNKAVEKIAEQFILSKTTKDNTLDVNKKIIISKNQGSKSKSSDGGINLAHSSPKNPDITYLPSTECKSSLRIRKVQEINNAELSKKTNCIKKDGVNKCAEKLTSINEVNYNNSNEINDSDKNSTPDDYHKPKPKQPLKLIKLQGNNLARKILIPRFEKTSSPLAVQTKGSMPVVFNSRLVKENKSNGTNSKIIQISNIGMISDGKKNTILVKRKYVDAEKPFLIEVPPDETLKSKLDCVENEKNFITKQPVVLLKSRACEADSNLQESSVVKPFEFFDDLRVNNLDSVPNNSFHIFESTLNESEESISFKSEICNQESIQLGPPENNTIDEVRLNSVILEDSINLQPENINEKPAGFHPLYNQQTCDKKISSDDSTLTTAEKSVDYKAIRESPSKLTYDYDLEPLKEDTLKNNKNEFYKNNCQDIAKDHMSHIIKKRCLFDHENGSPNKKLRSENLRQCPLQYNSQLKEPVSSRNCIILMRRNSYKKSYFYSPPHGCYLPKFLGFKKHELRPRSMLIALRNLQKLLKN